MALFNMENPLVLTFGILGNLVAFLVYLAPAPTFYRILKKKSTEGFQSVPYVVGLLSCMLWIYYATLKSNETLLITINSLGSFIEAIYIFIYISYAPKNAKILALELIMLLNVFGFGLILVLTHFLVKGSQRVHVLGWISVILSVSVYVAPLSIMKKVIQTKSVEFMPISLSSALLLNAVMWFFYGLLLKDFYITVPNIVGFIFGVIQIILYLIYKKCKVQDKIPTTIKAKIVISPEIHPVCSLPAVEDNQNLEINITVDADEINGESEERMVELSN
ncbi:hypothetical protein ABFS82_04G121900 [Erythranthe guttata]